MITTHTTHKQLTEQNNCVLHAFSIHYYNVHCTFVRMVKFHYICTINSTTKYVQFYYTTVTSEISTQ